ncbi:unnamed protein product [Rhizoctonia solani]|uniref:Uncharacterized protein n=1 Tax=Rhizoctonia solani TaxID=456999 RepID=A0A8H3DR53_9AGAM|nr:unnamed protein product [Rhizoctonia solani]
MAASVSPQLPDAVGDPLPPDPLPANFVLVMYALLTGIGTTTSGTAPLVNLKPLRDRHSVEADIYGSGIGFSVYVIPLRPLHPLHPPHPIRPLSVHQTSGSGGLAPVCVFPWWHLKTPARLLMA